MMKRTTVDGRVVNVRTAEMLKMWEFNSLQNYYVLQGSYNRSVSQSGGTHDGGGAIDLSVYGLGDVASKKWHVKQGRLAGFAAYYRPTLPGEWNEHIHAVAIGDPELSGAASRQVVSYYHGRDALASNNVDPDPRVKPIPVWPKRPLKSVNLLTAYRQFRAKDPKPKMAVKRIQWVLNEKLGLDLKVDGIAGRTTRDAYKRWERKVNAPGTDGVPGRYSLRKLGEGRFKVSTLTFERWRDEQRVNKTVAAKVEEANPTFPNK